MTSEPRVHGVDPYSRLVEMYVEVIDTPQRGRVGQVCRRAFRRAADGNFERTPDKVRWTAYHTQGVARDADESAALGAALGLFLLAPSDFGTLHMPSRRSVRLVLNLDTHPWPYRTPELEQLIEDATATLDRISDVIAEPRDSQQRTVVRATLQAHADKPNRPVHRLMNSYTSAKANRMKTKPFPECLCVTATGNPKARYGTKEQAELDLLRLSSAPGKRPVRAYQCPTTAWWHLTSKLRRWNVMGT